MRHIARVLLLSALAMSLTACQNPVDALTDPPPRARAAPAVPAAASDEKPARAAAKPAAAWVGDSADLGGRGSGTHLRVSVVGQVDPAVGVRAADRPASGSRWVGFAVTLLNFGGKPHEVAGARAWVVDDTGERHRPVTTGTLTTGAPLRWNTLSVGEQRKGWLVFEVPERARIVRLHTVLGDRSLAWQLRFPPSR
ncbi:hypothetical protein GCM10010232_30830 [Streptomyces amakusaensis]|uniref:DUF4352 domain-containing protein n=1 Tax=Streptomyces amakusaensis TaxID=67271 RepID=A0ABW0AAC5_9ACTN